MNSFGFDIEEHVQRFLLHSPDFQRVCKEVFESSGGKVSLWESYAITLYGFEKLREPLDRYGLRVELPSSKAVEALFQESDTDHDGYLNYPEFEHFMAGLLELGAVAAARDFSKKYGVGMIACTAGVALLKRVVLHVPGGTALRSCFAFLPTVVLGPIVGAAIVFGRERRDESLLRQRVGDAVSSIYSKMPDCIPNSLTEKQG